MNWYLKLQEYHYTIQHVPGKTNTKADILSRLEWYEEQIETDKVTMLKDEVMIRNI